MAVDAQRFPARVTRTTTRRPLGQRQRRLLALVVGAVLLADAAAFYVVGNTVTPVTVGQAIARFRVATPALSPALGPAAAAPASATAATPATAAPRAGAPTAKATQPAAGPAGTSQQLAATPLASGGTPARIVPAAGVYVYATSGYEEVSVLGGSRHTYPAQTTMTVTHTPCGADVRWDGLQQRWDRWDTCAQGAAILLRAFTTYHNFYGQVDERTYTCSTDTAFRPGSDAPGTKFTGDCKAPGADAALLGSVVGTETILVGGQAVSALRVHIDERLSGATRGTRSSDSWYALGTDLLLKRTSVTDADTNATFGSTHYHEELAVQASSLTPLR